MSSLSRPVMGQQASTYIDPFTGMEFVYVQGGKYQMGDTFGDVMWESAKPHEVFVADLWVGKYEVTQGEWEMVMGKDENLSSFNKGPRYPVEYVSWNDVQIFIKELNKRSGCVYRLPTEEEWEYSARSGGKKERWAGTSDKSQLGEYAWYVENAGDSTTHEAGTREVGTRKPNGLGLYDMSGNVAECCSSSSGPGSVMCGGGWEYGRYNALTVYRPKIHPDARSYSLGFRLVLSPDQ